MKLKMEAHNFYCIFYKQNVLGHWRKIWQIGNLGVGIEVYNFITQKLHIPIKFVDYTTEIDG